MNADTISNNFEKKSSHLCRISETLLSCRPIVSSFIAASLKGMTRCAGNIAGTLSEMHINFRICFKDYLFETEVWWVAKSCFFVTYSHVQCLASAFPLYFLSKTRYLSTCTFLTKYKGNTLAKHWTWLYVTKYQDLATHNTSVSNK